MTPEERLEVVRWVEERGQCDPNRVELHGQIDVAIVLSFADSAPQIKFVTLGVNPTADSGQIAVEEFALTYEKFELIGGGNGGGA